jgi:HlyD family secretion protein
MKITKRRWGVLVAAIAAVVLTAFAFRPRPVAVEAVRAARGPLMTTIDEQGFTRVRERYEIASPVAGQHARIAVHAGDEVAVGTPLVQLDPAPLDARQIDQLTARMRSAEKLASEAAAAARRARAAYDLATKDRARAEALASQGIAAKTVYDEARSAELQRARDVDAARFRAESAKFDVDVARAALLTTESGGAAAALQIKSPVRGRVLRVLHESEGVVAAGQPLLEIGDLDSLEVVVDVLSTDGVNVRAGSPLIVERWGGERPLRGTVRLVEPSAFTKISALGVEEQRVYVVGDLDERPPQLGDRYRVEARIVLWQGTALKVPATALFRDRDGWALFVVERGRARVRHVTLGHQSATEAAIAGGVRDGELVITHPSDLLRDGARVALERS